MEPKPVDVELEPEKLFPKFEPNRARLVIFAGSYPADNGEEAKVRLRVHIRDGDAWGLVEAVKDNGGIGVQTDDSGYLFLPWPCQAIEIHDVK